MQITCQILVRFRLGSPDQFNTEIRTMKYIKEIESFGEFLENGYHFDHCCFQKIDFSKASIRWESLKFNECVFLGCKLPPQAINLINDSGNLIFPDVNGLPYQVYRAHLYKWQDLYAPANPDTGYHTIDEEIYYHFKEHRYNGSIHEHLYQRIHDHSIDDAMRDLLEPDDNGGYKKKCIGIMGGHSTKRDNIYYKKIARIAFHLTQSGYFIASGGGPGIMEAANLGAYMATYSEEDLEKALNILHGSLHYSEQKYFDDAHDVLLKYDKGADNLAIPTWFYGHEPSNLFATHIAKYFSNSIREDILLAISIHGIVFAPGSAGTHQEIFMDAAQNHYGTFSYFSPMVFLGMEHYMKKTGIYPLLQRLSRDKEYGRLLYVHDSVDQIVSFFRANPPTEKQD